MHLRRLIVLITYIRNIISRSRSCTLTDLRHRIGFLASNQSSMRVRKKTKNHVASLCLPEGVGSNGTESDLFTMSKYPARERLSIQTKPNLLSSSRSLFIVREPVITGLTKGMVEPDGIEPTTSCLQSRRSPS